MEMTTEYVMLLLLLFSVLLSSTSISSSSSVAPTCNAVTLATVVTTTGDVSWSVAAMQAYQTLGCPTPGATGFGSAAFYGQSPSPYSAVPTGSYADGMYMCPVALAVFTSDVIMKHASKFSWQV